MHFQVHRRERDISIYPETAPQLVAGYGWTLETVDGTTIARSPHDTFDTEAAARSNIAKAKKTMKAAMRCKVKSP